MEYIPLSGFKINHFERKTLELKRHYRDHWWLNPSWHTHNKYQFCKGGRKRRESSRKCLAGGGFTEGRRLQGHLRARKKNKGIREYLIIPKRSTLGEGLKLDEFLLGSRHSSLYLRNLKLKQIYNMAYDYWSSKMVSWSHLKIWSFWSKWRKKWNAVFWSKT